ncbi:MAG: lamin tail domain-containing protein [Gammaproteobacteria bacterium]
MLRKIQIHLFILLSYLGSISHAATIQTGDLLISEVMANPSAVSDTNGEWFEIFNASAKSIDINGLIISDDGSNSHQINNGAGLFIASGAYLVLGRNINLTENGGYSADYVYSNFTLGNTLDQIVLSDNTSEIARLNYTGAPFGANGVSAELINQLTNTNQSNYQLSQNDQYGLGDTGTPGRRGSLELVSTSPVPVPGAVWLFASALLILGKKFKSAGQKCRPIGKYSLC